MHDDGILWAVRASSAKTLVRLRNVQDKSMFNHGHSDWVVLKDGGGGPRERLLPRAVQQLKLPT